MSDGKGQVAFVCCTVMHGAPVGQGSIFVVMHAICKVEGGFGSHDWIVGVLGQSRPKIGKLQ
jgi:hypothetical protein